MNKICILLAGRVVEKIIFNNYSTGSLNDLKSSTNIAISMVKNLGFSKLGHISYNYKYSEKTAQKIDKEVINIINKEFIRCKNIIIKNLVKLKLLVIKLLKKGVLYNKDIRKILNN